MDPQAFKEYIMESIASDCIALFRHYGCTINQTEADTFSGRAMDVLATIDAGCDEMEITLHIATTEPLLALSYPCADMAINTTEEQLEDWLREIANQLMGKIKNRLIRRGANITLGLPSAYFDVDNIMEIGGYTEQCRFVADGEVFDAYVDIEVKSEHLELLPEQEDDGGTFDGEIELF